MTIRASKSNLSLPWRISRTGISALAALHLFFTVAALASPLALWVKLMLVLVLLSNALWLTREHRRLASITHISVIEGVWHITADDRTAPARICKPPVVCHWLVILYLRCCGRRWSIPVLADSATVEDFRSLRVYLRLHAVNGSGMGE